jgi:hypothetical protein
MNPIRHWLDAAEEFANDKNIEGAVRALITGVTILAERQEPKCDCDPKPKPLSLYNLKRQVDIAVQVERPTEPGDFVWVTPDFEIRRRK